MAEVIEIQGTHGEHVALARWPHESARLPSKIVREGRLYILIGHPHGVATYGEIAGTQGAVWVVPDELVVDETPIATRRVSESELLPDLDLPDTIEPPPSSERRIR